MTNISNYFDDILHLAACFKDGVDPRTVPKKTVDHSYIEFCTALTNQHERAPDKVYVSYERYVVEGIIHRCIDFDTLILMMTEVTKHGYIVDMDDFFYFLRLIDMRMFEVNKMTGWCPLPETALKEEKGRFDYRFKTLLSRLEYSIPGNKTEEQLLAAIDQLLHTVDRINFPKSIRDIFTTKHEHIPQKVLPLLKALATRLSGKHDEEFPCDGHNFINGVEVTHETTK